MTVSGGWPRPARVADRARPPPSWEYADVTSSEQDPGRFSGSRSGIYVDSDCCVCCDVPIQLGKGLFEYDAQTRCRPCRQPQTPDEINAAIIVLWNQDVGCIRYGGHDLDLLRRLGELGLADVCDDPRARQFPRVSRTLGIVRLAQNANVPDGALEVLRVGISGLSRADHSVRIETTTDGHRYLYRWWKRAQSWIESRALPSGEVVLTVHASPTGAEIGIAIQLDEELKKSPAIGSVRWTNREGFDEGSPSWSPTPY